MGLNSSPRDLNARLVPPSPIARFSAAPPYQNTSTVSSASPQALTVEGFLKEATRLRPNFRKRYHSKAAGKKRLKSKDIQSAAYVSPKIRAAHEHEDAHEADNTLGLRSREIPRVLLSESSQASLSNQLLPGAVRLPLAASQRLLLASRESGGSTENP